MTCDRACEECLLVLRLVVDPLASGDGSVHCVETTRISVQHTVTVPLQLEEYCSKKQEANISKYEFERLTGGRGILDTGKRRN